MLKKLILHGALADHLPASFGGVFECVFLTAREAASAIEANFPGFFQLIRDMELHIVIGDEKYGESFDEKQALTYTITADQVHLMPALSGSGMGGGGGEGGPNMLKVVLGVALIAVAFVGTGGLAGGLSSLGGAVWGNSFGITGTQLLMLGAGLVLTGLTQPPETKEVEEKKSAIYSGPLNTQAQGSPVPYTAGLGVIAGGVIIHADLIIESVEP